MLKRGILHRGLIGTSLLSAVLGESITYNPDRTFRSMVDDVRPFLVQAQDNNGRWNWTGNVGGGLFTLLQCRE